jgi:lipoprotein-anchoring transpeptidase ErfK/SrfK
MRSRVPFIFAAVAALILVLVAGAYAYDRSGNDRIPKGVTIAGVDVGGLNATQAKARLDRDYLPKLRQSVRVHFQGKYYTLSAARSQVAVNIDKTVDDAVAQAHKGNMFSRDLRRLTGGRVHTALAPEATYSHRASADFLSRIRDAVNRDPVDATATFASLRPTITPGRDGLKLMAHELHAQIDRAIVDPSAPHTLSVRTQHVQPAVDTAKIRSQYATALVVDRSHFQLHLYKNLHLVKTYEVAIGMVGLDTPAGLYHIQNKAVDPAWTEPNSSWVAPADRGKVVPGGTAANPLKARWLGIFDGAGIHGVDPSEYGTIGHQASHGCVRMRIPDVIDLYPRVPVGAPIYIA